MKAVSRFEANLLSILHFFLRRRPATQALPLVGNRYQRPPCLSRAAVELVQDSLAKGCVAILARDGGWRRERFLRGEQTSDGRLWERSTTNDLALRFSIHSLRFLVWITAVKPSDEKPRWLPPEKDLTVGDWLLFFLAYQALRGTEHGPALRSRFPFSRHALCRLAYPQDFAESPGNAPPNFLTWTSGAGACILEVWQRELAHCWVQAERAKGQIDDWQRMQAISRIQKQVLTQFGQAVTVGNRRDLARFLLQAAATLLREDATAEQWIAGLTTAGPRLTDRAETYRAALAFLRQLDMLRDWARQARTVGYLDEGYAASQLWKADWEHWQGDVLHARAQTIIRQLEPFRGED